MPVIETTLHASYQLNEWNLKEAAREIISNAIDGEERNRAAGVGQMNIDYSKRKKVLTIRNEGVKVPTRALLMGTSESREDDACIGTFGEGLPMALLVLARKGLPVTIYNGDEKWTPKIEKSSTFSDEPVLVIHTRQLMKDRNAFIVEMHDIEADEAAELRSMFLSLDKDFDKDQTVKGYSFNEQRVLKQPQYQGKIYNKGVFVMERKDLLFGYDLAMETNRDRHMVAEWKLQHELGSLLNRAMQNDPEALMPIFIEALMSGDDRLELKDEYSPMSSQEDIIETVTTQWLQAYEGCIPVLSSEEAQEAARIGKTGMQVNPLLYRILQKNLGTLFEHQQKHKRRVDSILCLDDLSTAQYRTLDRAVNAVNLANIPQESWPHGRIRVVLFAEEGTKSLTNKKTNEIYLAQSVLRSFKLTVRALVAEVTRRVESTEERSHTDRQFDVFTEIVNGFYS